MTRSPVVAGNWKMHGTRGRARALVQDIAQGLDPDLRCEVVVFPPFVHLDAALQEAEGSPVRVGAQNVHAEPQGAHTGEISLGMLIDLGCSEVLIGHSERRHIYGETDEIIAAKFARVATEADAPRIVLCVGETRAQRDAGKTLDVIRAQLACVRPHPEVFPRTRIAYEPVWAIGTGQAATPAMAQEVHRTIRAELDSLVGESAASGTSILYGGSVKASIARELFAQDDIDGVLVGGASLKAGEFLDICHAVRK